MNDLNAPRLLQNLLAQFPPRSPEDISSRVVAALHSETTPTQRIQYATQVLSDSVATPEVFVALAKHIPTPWIDFLNGAPSLWSQIIDQTINEIQSNGAGASHPLFALVRRWTHPQSVHGITSSQHPSIQLYWTAMQTIALHDKGYDFVQSVRATKGPVRQWMDDFHRHIAHPETIDGVPLLEKMMLDLPRTATSDSLWIWRVERNSQWDRGYEELPYEKLRRSPLSPSTVAFTVWRNSPGKIRPNLRKNIFTWDTPLELIQEIKNRYADYIFSDFAKNLIEDNLNFPLSENVWKAFVADPLKFMVVLDVSADFYRLMDEYKNAPPRHSGKKSVEKIVQFMSKMWQDAGKMQKNENDPWINFSHALHVTGLLPHVVFESWGCCIEEENLRWNELKNIDDAACVWKMIRAQEDLINIDITEDTKRLILLKMMELNPLQYQQMVHNNPDLRPSELTSRQCLTLTQTLCDQIAWSEQPLQKIEWMANFFTQMKNIHSLVDARTVIIRGFMKHFNIASDVLANTLTHDNETAGLLQDVLRHTTHAQFPYTQSHERPYAQTIEKFLLLEAAQYNGHATTPSKRKM